MTKHVIKPVKAGKNWAILTLTLSLLLLNFSCQKSDRNATQISDYSKIESVLPNEASEIGKAFALRIREKATKYPDLLKGDTSIKQSDVARFDAKMGSFNANSFTQNQWTLIGKLAKSFSESTSYSEMLNKYQKIAVEVSEQKL